MTVRHWTNSALLFLAGALLLSSCLALAKSREGTGTQAVAANPPAVSAPSSQGGREPLYGGDPRCWPTPAGNTADSNYCDVALKLPLSREPVWEFSYTPVRFSSVEPAQIAHYDGMLALISRCPQLLALDADTGRQLFNRDVYEHFDQDQAERFYDLFFSPLGQLIGRDNAGRQYCWDVTNGDVRRVWMDEGSDRFGAFIALTDRLISSSDGELRALDINQGERLWDDPMLGAHCGMVASASGILVAWTSLGRTSNGEF